MCMKADRQSSETSTTPMQGVEGVALKTGDNPMDLATLRVSLMHQAPRCGARTRSGEKCLSPAMKGKARCRIHGGAKGSGAP